MKELCLTDLWLKQIILVSECGMGYVKVVYMIGVPHGGNNSIKWNTHVFKVNKGANIRNRHNQVPHLPQDTNGKVTNSQ